MSTQRRSIRLSGSRGTLDPDMLRQRQSKRDETIRKKLEQDIQKRGPNTRLKTTATATTTFKRLSASLQRGLVVKEALPVMEAIQYMAAKKSDCLLVTNLKEQLCGILTAKDIAYRVVATSRGSLLVSEVMTPDPVRVTMDTDSYQVLSIMVIGGFRHVPVCSDDGEIVGIWDITTCLYKVLETMERAYGSSQRFFDALQGVEKEWAPMSVSVSTTTDASSSSLSSSSLLPPLGQLMDSLRTKMTCPDVSTLIASESTTVVQVSVKTSVRDVVKLMRDHGTTAVLVMDHDILAGIFCTKDLLLRVLAAGLAPDTCSVVRVMTPEPELAGPETTILQALKKMNDGHYMNLPVINKDKMILGMIDILSLTFATLELINNVKNTSVTDGLLVGDDTLALLDTESIVSTTSITSYPTHKDTSSGASTTCSQTTTATHIQQQQHQEQQQPREDIFTFKFTYHSKTYRFRSYVDRFDALYQTIQQRLGKDGFTIYYMDEDHDRVVMTCDADVMDAVRMADGQDRALLFVTFEQDDGKKEQEEEKKKENQRMTGKDENSRCSFCKHQRRLWVPMTLLGVILLGAYKAKSRCRF